MQLRLSPKRSSNLLSPKRSSNLLSRSLIIKIIIIFIVFFLGIFLVDKINFPAPNKIIKQEISNDKIITVR